MAAKTDNKKTMDVSKPGDTAPNTSGRPVIVTHHPMVQDPMVKVQESDTESVKVEGTAVRGSKKIEPISTSLDIEAETKNQPEAEETLTLDSTPKDSAVSEEAIVDAVANQTGTAGKKKKDELSAAQKAQEESLQKLIVDKTYFVPIGQSGRRQQRRTLLVASLLLAILVGVYLAVDIGLITTTIDLPLDIVKN